MQTILRQIEEQPFSQNEKTLLCDWVRFLKATRGLSLYTVQGYIRATRDFFTYLHYEEIELETATPKDVERWQRAMALHDRLKGSTRHLKVVALRQFFSWAARNDYLQNIVLDAEKIKLARTIPKKFSTAQLARMFGVCRDDRPIGVRDKALLLTMYSTGLRRSEMIGLNLDQLLLKDEIGAVRVTGKGSKERIVSFGSETTQAIKRWLMVRDTLPLMDERAVWVSLSNCTTGQRLTKNGLRDILQRIGRAAGVRDVRPHKMRSTFATDLYDAGVDLERIRLLMGHSNLDTTRKYLAISEKHMNTRMPAARIREILGKGDALPMWFQQKLESRKGPRSL